MAVLMRYSGMRTSSRVEPLEYKCWIPTRCISNLYIGFCIGLWKGKVWRILTWPTHLISIELNWFPWLNTNRILSPAPCSRGSDLEGFMTPVTLWMEFFCRPLIRFRWKKKRNFPLLWVDSRNLLSADDAWVGCVKYWVWMICLNVEAHWFN